MAKLSKTPPPERIETSEETKKAMAEHTAAMQRRRYAQTDWKFLGQEVPEIRKQKSFGQITRFMLNNKYNPRAHKIYVNEVYVGIRRFFQFMDEADAHFFWLLLGKRSKHKIITQDQFNAFKALGVKFYQKEEAL